MPARPHTQLDTRFSEPGAKPTKWSDTEAVLDTAELWSLTTVRGDGRPHTTPLIAVWDDGALHFTTGPGEQKHRNLAANPHCTLATGNGVFGLGLDVVVEGAAERVDHEDRLRELAALWIGKYGEAWRFGVESGSFVHDEGGSADVFAVRPGKILSFHKGPHSQTRYRF